MTGSVWAEDLQQFMCDRFLGRNSARVEPSDGRCWFRQGNSEEIESAHQHRWRAVAREWVIHLKAAYVNDSHASPDAGGRECCLDAFEHHRCASATFARQERDVHAGLSVGNWWRATGHEELKNRCCQYAFAGHALHFVGLTLLPLSCRGYP